jgi:hypothetical protein
MFVMSQTYQGRGIPEQATLAERIRRFAFENYVAPVYDAPNSEIRIRAGDVHKAMGLSGRMPAVCGALDAMIFQREYGLELARRTGPAQGANVEFVFRIKGPVPPRTSATTRLQQPRSSQPSPFGQGTHAIPPDSEAALPQPKLRFTLRGKTFEKTIHGFVEAVVGKAPSRIQRYSTLINGVPYPIRQVVACATGLPAIAITSQDAYRILEKFGFAVESHEDTTALRGGQLPAEADGEAPPVALGTVRLQEHPVSMKIELPREIGAGLAARAAAEGVSLPEYVSRLLMEQLAPDATGKLSPAERAAAWREGAKGLPRTPPLSDEAISRESIYGDRC